LMGSIFTAIGQIQEGRVAEAQGKFAKEIAIRNQQALERQAAAEVEASEIEERRIARREKIFKATQRVTVGKSGVGLAGATLSVLADTAFQFSLERNLALRTGLIRSRELIERGRIIAAQGRFARTLGKQAKKLSFFKAAGSILGGASGGEFNFLSSSSSSGVALSNQSPSGSAGFGRTTGGIQRV
ncbi:hypothetical protein LCGC14_3023890, partial [marine sediment metagenome]